MYQIWSLFILFCIFTSSNSKIKEQGNGTRLHGTDFVEQPDIYVTTGVLSLLPYLRSALANSTGNISAECKRDCGDLINDATDRKTWALQLFDSIGRPQSGILSGSLLWPADYDQCLGIQSPTRGGHVITGGYCSTILRTDFNASDFAFDPGSKVSVMDLHHATIGLCLPYSCSNNHDASALVKAVILELPESNGLSALQTTCPPESVPFTPEAVVASIVCCLLGVLLLVGTAMEYTGTHRTRTSTYVPWYQCLVNHKNNRTISQPFESGEALAGPQSPEIQSTENMKPEETGTFVKILLCFSMFTNGKKILKASVSKDALSSVNGIRVLSMTWIILCHTFLSIFSYPNMRKEPLLLLKRYSSRWTSLVILNGFFAVDTFFLLSGFLVTYNVLQEMKKRNGKIKWWIFYFHRFWRLSPVYYISLMVWSCLFQYWSSGPFWPERSVDHEYCVKYWWTNILYINNFWDVDKMCAGWTWFLANDMQFHIISPLIIYPLYNHPIVGQIMAMCIILVSIAYRVTMSVIYKQEAGIPPLGSEDGGWLNEVYLRPYGRIGAYMVGMLLGYILMKHKGRLTLPKIPVIFGWIVAGVCLAALIFGPYAEYKNGDGLLGVDALYNGVSRTLWCIGVMWIILAGNLGHGGFVNTVLSLPIWTPLSRLTYCAYLIHPIIMFTVALSQRTPVAITDLNILYVFVGHWTLTYISAYFASIALEAPWIQMEKIMFDKKRI